MNLRSDRIIHKHRQTLTQAVCEDHRVEQTVTITKNAAQASNIGVGRGPQRAECARWGGVKGPTTMKSKKLGVGPTPLVALTLSRARVFVRRESCVCLVG